MSTRYAKEFRDRAVRLLAESRENYASETKALQGVAKDLGVAAESLRRWQAKADTAGTAGPEESGELRRLRRENAQLRRANEILSSASALFASRLDPTRRGWSSTSTLIATGSGSGRSARSRGLRWLAGFSPPEHTGRSKPVPPAGCVLVTRRRPVTSW